MFKIAGVETLVNLRMKVIEPNTIMWYFLLCHGRLQKYFPVIIFYVFFLTENNATFLDNFLTLISLQHLLINYGLRSVLATLYRPLLVEMIY